MYFLVLLSGAFVLYFIVFDPLEREGEAFTVTRNTFNPTNSRNSGERVFFEIYILMELLDSLNILFLSLFVHHSK